MSTRLEPMPALLDRQRERAALDGLLGDLRSGRGRALVVRGEAGVGKSALLEYLAGAAVVAAQPLAVEQVRAGQLGPLPGAAQRVDRFPVQALRGLAVAQQRAAARLDAQAEVGRPGLGELRQPGQGTDCDAGIPGVDGGLDQLG